MPIIGPLQGAEAASSPSDSSRGSKENTQPLAEPGSRKANQELLDTDDPKARNRLAQKRFRSVYVII